MGARIPSKLVMRVRFSSPAPSDVPSQGSSRHTAMRLQKGHTGPGPQHGPLVSGHRPAPLSPSFPVGHANSILVTRHGSIPGGSCKRSRRFLRSHDLRFSGQIRAASGRSPLDRGIQGSRRRGGSCLLRRGFCKIDVQRAAASAELTVWTSSSHDAMNFSAPSASKAATTSW